MDADWSVELGSDDPALEFPWGSPDGTQRYVDLPGHPERLTEIPEAVQFPELGEFLLAVNAASSPWLTVKCDAWSNHELGEAEAIYEADRKLCCYIDLVAREPARRFSFERHEAWVKSAARAVSSDADDVIACEFIVRRCWFHPDQRLDPASMTLGFYVTLYLSGYGCSGTEARARWAQGLRTVTSVLTASAV